MAINRTSPKKGKVVDIPDATITIGTPTAGAGQVSVAFTVATTPATGGPVQGYTAISNPGSITANASASPIVVTGLTNDTAYTFQVAARNATGRGPLSAASASATPVDPAGFVSIATTTVGSGGVSSITFSSIPSTYKHLQIRMMTPTSGASDQKIRVGNSSVDTGTNYSFHYLFGDGSARSSGSSTSTTHGYLGYSVGSAQPFSAVVDILDYTNTNKYKTIRTLSGQDYNGSSSYVMLTSSLWMSSSAIDTITVFPDVVNFSQYSSFALYGIKG